MNNEPRRHFRGWPLLFLPLAAAVAVLAWFSSLPEEPAAPGPDRPGGGDAAESHATDSPEQLAEPAEITLVPDDPARIAAALRPAAGAERLAQERARRERDVDALRRRAVLEKWEEQYGSWGSRELQAAWAEIDDQIIAATNEYFEIEFAAGRVEFWADDDPVLLELRKNPLIIHRIRYEPGNPLAQRVVLPTTGFEDLHAQRGLSVWLLSRSRNGEIAGLPPK
jgi:hypothetical protein